MRPRRPDQVLVDEKVDQDSTDDGERAANAYALELLTGAPHRRYYATGRWPNAVRLAESAKPIGRYHQIDPGHIVLNHGKAMGSTFFAVANAAVSHLDPTPDAVGTIRRTRADTLDGSERTEESAEFVAKMAGLDTDSSLSCSASSTTTSSSSSPRSTSWTTRSVPSKATYDEVFVLSTARYKLGVVGNAAKAKARYGELVYGRMAMLLEACEVRLV